MADYNQGYDQNQSKLHKVLLNYIRLWLRPESVNNFNLTDTFLTGTKTSSTIRTTIIPNNTTSNSKNIRSVYLYML